VAEQCSIGDIAIYVEYLNKLVFYPNLEERYFCVVNLPVPQEPCDI